MLLICLRSIFIDALSLGCSKLPSTQVFNTKQGPRDSPSYPTIRTCKPPRYSSALGMKGDKDSHSPFFAKKEPEENADEKDSSNSCINNAPSPFFAQREDAFQIESPTLREENESKSGDLPFPFFGTKEDQLEILGESLDLEKLEKPDDKLPSPFFASKENQLQNLRESLSLENVESPNKPEKVSDDDQKPPFFALKEDELQILKEPLNLDDNRATGEDVGKVTNSASDFASPFFGEKEEEKPLVPIEDIPINSKFIAKSQSESYKELIESFKRPGDDTSEIFENTMKTALNVIKDLPANVEKAVDTSQKIFHDVQDVTRKVNEVTRQTVQKTQEAVKEVQDFSHKIQENLEKTQAAIKDVQDSFDDTKQIVEEQIEKTQGVVKDVKDFSSKISESEAASKAKVLLQLEQPKTLTEEALDLAGKATIASAKLTLWGTKRVGSLALKSTKSIYNNTIGPDVEQVWNEQMDSLNDSVGKATGVWNDKVESLNDTVEKATGALNEQVESINSSVEKAALYVKDTPSRVKSVVTESINEVKKPKRIQSSSASEDSATVSRSTNGTNQQQYELNRELDEAQKLVREISQSLGVVERSMSITNAESEELTKIEVEDHSKETAQPNMVMDANVEANEPEDKIDEKPFESEALDEPKKNTDKTKRKTGMGKVLSRFKPPSFKTAKTQGELDAEIQKAESLAKEIAQALDTAEEAMSRTSEGLESIEKEIDEWSENSS